MVLTIIFFDKIKSYTCDFLVKSKVVLAIFLIFRLQMYRYFFILPNFFADFSPKSEKDFVKPLFC